MCKGVLVQSKFNQGNRFMILGYGFVISAAVCWGLIGIFSSIAFDQGIEPMEVAFWRAVIAGSLFGLQAMIKKETYIAVKDIPLLVVFGLLGISLFFISYLYAIKHGGTAFAVILLYTAPAWVIVCAYFLYREKLTMNKIFSVGLVVAGVYLITKTGGNIQSVQPLSGMVILAGLSAGFCYSLYYTMGKYFSSKYSSANLFLYVFPVGVIGIFPLVDFAHKTPLAWLAMGLVAVVSTYFANHCYYAGLKRLEASKASIVATLEPVVAAAAAYFIFGEQFVLLGYLGAGAIIIAVVLTIIK